MGLIADFRELRRKGRAERLRAQINTIGKRRQALMRQQFKLTRQAEELEGTANKGPTAEPRFMRPRRVRHTHSTT